MDIHQFVQSNSYIVLMGVNMERVLDPVPALATLGGKGVFARLVCYSKCIKITLHNQFKENMSVFSTSILRFSFRFRMTIAFLFFFFYRPFLKLIFLAHLNSSLHWTQLRGNYSEPGIFPSTKGAGGGWPGSRAFAARASIGDTLFLFGGVGYANDSLVTGMIRSLKFSGTIHL